MIIINMRGCRFLLLVRATLARGEHADSCGLTRYTDQESSDWKSACLGTGGTLTLKPLNRKCFLQQHRSNHPQYTDVTIKIQIRKRI